MRQQRSSSLESDWPLVSGYGFCESIGVRIFVQIA